MSEPVTKKRRITTHTQDSMSESVSARSPALEGEHNVPPSNRVPVAVHDSLSLIYQCLYEHKEDFPGLETFKLTGKLRLPLDWKLCLVGPTSIVGNNIEIDGEVEQHGSSLGPGIIAASIVGNNIRIGGRVTQSVGK